MKTKYFKELHMCLLPALCIVACVFAGCGKDKNLYETAGNTETVENTGNTETVENTGNSGSAENPVSPDEAFVSPVFQDLDILHPTIATKNIYTAKPNDSDNFIDIKWNTVALSGESAEKYPRLAKALASYARKLDEEAENFNIQSRTQAYEYFETEGESLKSRGEYTDDWYLNLEEWPYSLNSMHRKRLYIVRCDEVAFSVKEDFSNYSGGTHGYYANYGRNFDTETGHELDVEDVVNDLDKLNQILHDKLMSEYADLLLEDDHVWNNLKYKAAGEFGYDYAWLLSHDKVTFYFNPYELTAFAGGMQTIDIYFSEYPNLFKEKYTKAADEYVLDFGKSGEIKLDVDGDGKAEEISAYVVEQNMDYFPEDTEPYCSTICVTINGETDNFSVDNGYAGNIYLVHTGKGTYLYFNTYIFDYSSLMCIDISNGYAKRVHKECKFEPYVEDEKYDGTDLLYAMSEGSVERYKEAFTDPNHLTMSLGAHRITYCAGDDGMLKKEDEKEEQTSDCIKTVTPDKNIDFADTYWNAVYIEDFTIPMTDAERFKEYDHEYHLDLFVYKDGKAFLRGVTDKYTYDLFSCRGKWVSDGRGGIYLTECTDPDGDVRDYYDSYLVPHVYPAEIEIDGTSGLLAMEFYDKCLYLKQEEMPDEKTDGYSGIDLAGTKKLKKVIDEYKMAGEWVLNEIVEGNNSTLVRETGVVCTLSIWNDKADFYYYSPKEECTEQYYGMDLKYREENFSEDYTLGFTVFAFPDESIYEDSDFIRYFRIAPFGKSLMVMEQAEDPWSGASYSGPLYYFFRAE